MEQLIKTCSECDYSTDLTSEEFDVLICPKCGKQMDEID